MGALMDLEKLRLARSLYYQCLGELFVFSFSEERLSKLQEYLKTMQCPLNTSYAADQLDGVNLGGWG
ncbi:hypothetical protein ACISON_04920, partial [Campylobacter jejuni]